VGGFEKERAYPSWSLIYYVYPRYMFFLLI